MFGIGFVCLWVGKYVIMPFNSREGVSVGVFLKFFYVVFFCYVWYHGLFISCLGWCGCWTLIFFSCDKYLY